VEQITLLEELPSLATALHQIVNALLYDSHCEMNKVLQLVRRIDLNVRDAESQLQVLPTIGMKIPSVVQPHRWQQEPAVYSKAISTANLIAWTAHHSDMMLEGTEELMAAALLQDCGCLLAINGAQKSGQWEQSEQLLANQEHPRWSAAMMQKLLPASSQLAAMVAQHHEQLDGNGYPNKLTGHSLYSGSRLLALINRFIELCHAVSIDQLSACENPLELYHNPASQLFREAELGQWDLPMTTSFLKCLALPTQLSRQHRLLKQYQLRHDTELQSWHGPHWMSTTPAYQSHGASQHVESTRNPI